MVGGLQRSKWLIWAAIVQAMCPDKLLRANELAIDPSVVVMVQMQPKFATRIWGVEFMFRVSFRKQALNFVRKDDVWLLFRPQLKVTHGCESVLSCVLSADG